MEITIDKIQKIINKIRFKFPYSAEDYKKNLYLENYHSHTDFSNVMVPDSAETIENYAQRIKELNTKCLFSGEHGNQGNAFHVYSVAQKNNLKYRHSAEAYWVKNRFEKDKKNCHIILVAKNDEGRKDLNFALSIANESGYYFKPRLDMELILNIPKDNMIITTACLAGWGYEDAEQYWLKIANHFGDNFFVELQYHNTELQKKINRRVLDFAKKYNLQIIAGLDSHYVQIENSVKRKQIQNYKKVYFEDEEGWYMDYPNTTEVIKRFEEQGVLTEDEILTAIMNTNVFVNECEDIVFDKSFKIPTLYPDKSYEEKVKIFKKVLNEVYKGEKIKSKEKAEGIRWEATQIIESNTVDYFLTSKEIKDLSVNKYGGILTTTSRGSAASFVTNKLLGLTTVDRYSSEVPIYAERFLTKERVLASQMPDIDWNLAQQEPFVEATRELLGEHGVYPLMAVEVLKEKAAWQLYAGVNDVKPQDANIISKYLDEFHNKLKHAEEDEKDSIKVEDFIPEEYLSIYKQSIDYQGIAINLKVHACGHLILNGDIRREIGLITAISESTGKRTLCAAVEGKYLDEFGYVKQDFLIVDSCHLTHSLFSSIGMKVPSFEELREMVSNDDKTWEIYEKGITCCVNQCEKSSTTNKVKKYKPKSIAELASFIAAIRPGFASLINIFLSREPYSTGEDKIDKLLNDSASFMIYQESIMKVLSFLGLEMSETYNVIKSISKKKLKGKMKDDLLDQLKKSWISEFGNLDNFENVWKVIEDSASYAFNAPHAYSMAGDSLYQAWFKAHHTAKFYEVAITHYQEKNKKDKIDALVKEAIDCYDFKLGDYKFGNDNRKVNIDDEHKIIYPNLSSVKGFGENTVQTLYELGLKQYNDFIEVITALLENKINKTILSNLIKIDYFKEFGKINKLLEIYKYYNLFYSAKEISKKKIIENGLDMEMIKKYGNETLKKITKLNSSELFKDIVEKIPNEDISIHERLINQLEILGIISHTDESKSNREYFVVNLEEGKNVSHADIYEIKTGRIRKVKIWTKNLSRNKFGVNDLLFLYKVDKKNKQEKIGIDENGKGIWKPIDGEFEFWLDSYVVDRKEVNQ